MKGREGSEFLKASRYGSQARKRRTAARRMGKIHSLSRILPGSAAPSPGL